MKPLGGLVVDRRPPPRWDVALAAVFVIYGLGHVWFSWIPDEGYVRGSDGVNTVVVLLATLPLAWRRRAPLPVLAVIVATFSVTFSLFDALGSFYAELLPSLLAGYSVARYAPPRQVVAGLGVTAAGWALLIAKTEDFQNVDEIIFDAIVWTVAWLGGWTIRIGEERARELDRRAARVERESEAQARAAVVDERARIARELHDVVAHGMSLMVVQAGAARSLLGDVGDHRVHDHLRSLEVSGRQSLAEMRRLLTVLREHDELALEPLPGMGQLEALAAATRDAGIDLTVRVEGDAQALSPGIDLTAYRIIQEALTNTIKHAGPTSASITVRYFPHLLEVEIVDAGGIGGVGDGHGGGHGLIGMRERAALYGGDLEVGVRPTGGYGVKVRLPMAADV